MHQIYYWTCLDEIDNHGKLLQLPGIKTMRFQDFNPSELDTDLASKLSNLNNQ